jgi:hypothetical protein
MDLRIDIYGFHGLEDADEVLLGYDAMCTCRWVPAFRRNLLRTIFTPKMEAIRTYVPHRITTLLRILEISDSNLGPETGYPD